MKRSHLLSFTLSIVSTFALASSSFAASKDERIEQWGSQSVAVRANVAAQALGKKQYGTAMSNYRALIGVDKNNELFYVGLLDAAYKNENWNQAILALEEMFERKPELKNAYAKVFVDVLTKGGRSDYDIKQAQKLVNAQSEADIVEKKVKELLDQSLYDEVYVEPTAPKPKVRDTLDQELVHGDHSDTGLNYDNAFWSENIVIAEYTGFEKEKERAITFYSPPKAHYKIIERLKGAPLNAHIDVKYEFHDKNGKGRPDGWHFDEATMPKKGSQWILFLPSSVPVGGMLETYHGRWGRQEYNEENYDKILKIIENHRGQGK